TTLFRSRHRAGHPRSGRRGHRLVLLGGGATPGLLTSGGPDLRDRAGHLGADDLLGALGTLLWEVTGRPRTLLLGASFAARVRPCGGHTLPGNLLIPPLASGFPRCGHGGHHPRAPLFLAALPPGVTRLGEGSGHPRPGRLIPSPGTQLGTLSAAPRAGSFATAFRTAHGLRAGAGSEDRLALTGAPRPCHVHGRAPALPADVRPHLSRRRRPDHQSRCRRTSRCRCGPSL